MTRRLCVLRVCFFCGDDAHVDWRGERAARDDEDRGGVLLGEGARRREESRPRRRVALERAARWFVDDAGAAARDVPARPSRSPRAQRHAHGQQHRRGRLVAAERLAQPSGEADGRFGGSGRRRIGTVRRWRLFLVIIICCSAVLHIIVLVVVSYTRVPRQEPSEGLEAGLVLFALGEAQREVLGRVLDERDGGRRPRTRRARVGPARPALVVGSGRPEHDAAARAARAVRAAASVRAHVGVGVELEALGAIN
mmetsp:Transcript_23547/g.93343  ORF Transcript_23547/g.93343 Transcript_23547/m.93343 type:complete len:253 (+) Transcript_23547:283-1041(+)